MILGILSDTHGQPSRTLEALRILDQLGATAFVHCGDHGGPAVLDAFVGRHCWIVNGNTDALDQATQAYAAEVGLDLASPAPRRFTLAGRTFAVFHGHEPEFTRVLQETLRSGRLPAGFGACDYVLHGHTHVASDSRVGPLRVINPGALYRAATYTVATLDPAQDALRYWEVRDERASAEPREYEPQRDCVRARRAYG